MPTLDCRSTQPLAQAVRIGRDLLEQLVQTESVSPKLLKELTDVFCKVRSSHLACEEFR